MLFDVDVLHVQVGHDAVYLSLQDGDIFAITRTDMNSTICQCDQRENYTKVKLVYLFQFLI